MINIVACIALQLVGALGFIGISKTSFDEFGKPLVLLVFGLLTVALLTRETKTRGPRRLVMAVFVLAASLVVVHQGLGFAFFPGLMKDISPFSSDHMHITIVVFGLSFIAYFCAAVISWLLIRLLASVGFGKASS